MTAVLSPPAETATCQPITTASSASALPPGFLAFAAVLGNSYARKAFSPLP